MNIDLNILKLVNDYGFVGEYTRANIQTWLRETHNIMLQVVYPIYTRSTGKLEFELQVAIINDNHKSCRVISDTLSYETYNECFDNGLEIACNLIKKLKL